MSIKADDRIYETSTTTGTGTYTLAGAATGFQAFSAIGANNYCHYLATDGVNWEVGLGKYVSTPDRLERASVLSSSNGDAAVDWASGTRNLYCVFPAALMFPGVTARSSNTILGVADHGKTFAVTSTFTQTLTAAATLGDGWACEYRNDGTGIITLDPDSSEQINGATTLKLYQGESCRIICTGSAFKALFLSTGPVVISAAAASSSSSVDFTTGIDSNFEMYEIEITDLVPATNATSLYVRASQSGVFDSGGTSYAYTGGYNVDGGAWSVLGSAAASAMILATNLSTEATRSLCGRIRFWNPSGTTRRKKFMWQIEYEADGVTSTMVIGGGAFQNGVGAIDGARLIMSSGNIASGNITLRGYRRG